MVLLRLSLGNQRHRDDTSEANIKKTIWRHMDRKMGKMATAFKDSFHATESTPHGPLKFSAFSLLIRRMNAFQMDKLTLAPFEIIAFMRAIKKLTLDRRVVDDAFFAYAAISLFYESEDFLRSKYFEGLHPVIQHLAEEFSPGNQAESAKKVPDRRSSHSNKMLPPNFWDEWDKLHRDNQNDTTDGINKVDHFYPAEWDKAVRPKIARSGVICNSYLQGYSGVAVAHTEPGQAPDLYFDFRVVLEHIREMARVEDPLGHLRDPRPFTRSSLLTSARAFASKHANARFAALRIWSSEYFYPLEVEFSRRFEFSFIDGKRRAWEWKFFPTDIPYSEWSIHELARGRIRPLENFFGDKVIVATDLYLVMGETEAELRKLAVAVTFAVQKELWQMEIDFWRSFVNVDLKFLEFLDPAWLETAVED